MNALQYQILTEKGIDKEVIQVLKEVFQSKDDRLATKDDIELAKLALQKEMKGLDLKFTKEMKGLDLRLTKEMKDLELKLTKEMKDLELKLTKEVHRSNLKVIWVMVGLLTPMYIGILSLVIKILVL